jgi:hypothetical protein
MTSFTVLLIVVVILAVIGLQYQAVKGDHGFEHETCLDLTIEQCNEVNEKAKTEQVFLLRCSVFLTDRQEITVYKGKQTCTDWQIEYGSMTYEQWQEHKDQEFIDQLSLISLLDRI